MECSVLKMAIATVELTFRLDEYVGLFSSPQDHPRQIGEHWPTTKEQILFPLILSGQGQLHASEDLSDYGERIGNLAPNECHKCLGADFSVASYKR
jgi:hypothetical protein